jgi:hypothetical protein
MSDDPKLDFYLKNRALIEEWAKLREPAAAALDRELLAAALRLTEGDDVADPQIHEGPARSVRLHVTTDPLPRAWLELWWEKGKLLKGSGSWPQHIIVMDPPDPRVRDAVKSATGSAREAHGMTSTGPRNSPWIRYGEIRPQTEPIVIEEYAEYCLQRLREAWIDLHVTITEAVEKTPASS